jgi:hypothetical protein
VVIRSAGIFARGFACRVQNSAESRAPVNIAPAVPQGVAITRFAAPSYKLRAPRKIDRPVQNSQFCTAALLVGATGVAKNALNAAQNSANLVTECAHFAPRPRHIVRWLRWNFELSKNKAAEDYRSHDHSI